MSLLFEHIIRYGVSFPMICMLVKQSYRCVEFLRGEAIGTAIVNNPGNVGASGQSYATKLLESCFSTLQSIFYTVLWPCSQI